MCPECGTAIRATILYKVDPKAEEFMPLPRPVLLAWSLALWSFGGLIAAGACWSLRVADLIAAMSPLTLQLTLAPFIAAGAVALSGLGTLALVRPTAGTPLKHSLAAAASALAYVPLGWSMWRLLVVHDALHAPPYFETDPSAARSILRLIAGASLIVIIMGLRPVARELVKRSMVMRTGRVDRQTMYVMAATVAVAMAGDACRLFASTDPDGDLAPLALLGTVVIAVASGMFTLGLIGAAIDCWRIRRAILIPSPSLKQVLSPQAGAGG